MPSRPNLLLIMADQQRGDCYGFEGRKVARRISTAWRATARASPRASRRTSSASPRARRSSPAAAAHARRLRQRHRPAGGTRRGGLRRRLRAARATHRLDRQGAFHHVAHLHAHRHAGVPPSSTSTRRTGHGPYMGFEHVELMVEGHNHFPPMKPPRGQHYERWYHADGRGDELTASSTEDAAAAATDARADLALGAAGRLAQLDLDRRPHDRVPARASKRAVLRLGVVSRSAPSVRRAGAVEPAARPRRGRPAGAPHARPRAPAVVAPGEPRGQAADRRASCAVPRGVLAHAGADRRAAARADRQLLRDDLADRPQRRAHPARAASSSASPTTRSSSTRPTTATGSATTA